ncbi:MAG TPA: GNAT family N-acetyltransferase [Thermoanaerobaculia bacterium]|nr:GNAT family N-acetyltransferase [Thermoanaerobaculia bacterium]
MSVADLTRAMTYDIRNNEETSQFETTVDGHVAYVAYEHEEPNRIVFTHTIVPDALAGRGIAASLTKHALQHARDNDLKVVPQCAYVAKYMEKNAGEYRDLLAQR